MLGWLLLICFRIFVDGLPLWCFLWLFELFEDFLPGEDRSLKGFCGVSNVDLYSDISNPDVGDYGA
jgi:hypothetical protein